MVVLLPYTSLTNIENFMIKKYSLSVLQGAINHALALDESLPSKMQTLQGKVLEIIISPLNVNFFMTFTKRKRKRGIL